MAESEPVTGEVGEEEEEESEYSYVYETDSEYSYYTESEAEEEQGEHKPSTSQEPCDESTGITSVNDAAEVSNNHEQEEEEDENEALQRHKQQLEKFKPKVPDYVKSPEPCAFSDDPSTWIAWMETQVNKEKNRRMELIMQEVGDCVGKELLDTNIRGALSERLNTTAEFFYSKQIEFTNKKGDKRYTSFVCMKDLKERIEEIMRRRGIKNALVVISLDGGQE